METANTNGHAKKELTVEEMKAETKRLRVVNRYRQEKQAHKQADLIESFFDQFSWFNYGGGTDLWQNAWSNQTQANPGIPPAQAYDRSGGRRWPIWVTDVQLNRFRMASRIIVATNAFASGLLTNLTNSVIGKGLTYKVAGKDTEEAQRFAGPPQEAEDDLPAPTPLDKLANGTQTWLEGFMAGNNWSPTGMPESISFDGDDLSTLAAGSTKEREAFWRTARDGDMILRLFRNQDGTVDVRFVDPTLVWGSPPGTTLEDGWSFGIQHKVEIATDGEDGKPLHHHDRERVVAYYIRPKEPDEDQNSNIGGEIVYAVDIIHIKTPGEDAEVKHGTPVFSFDTLQALQRASNGQQITSLTAAVQASTAEYWKHMIGTKDQISSLQNPGARQSFPVQGNGQPVETFRPIPGQVRRGPASQEPIDLPQPHGPMFLEVWKGDLQQAGAAFSATESIISGDADTATYASMSEAGSLWVNAREADQEHFKTPFLKLMWRVVRWAVHCQRLPEQAMTLLDIAVEAPIVHKDNRAEMAQVTTAELAAKITSPQIEIGKRGNDPKKVAKDWKDWGKQTGEQQPPQGGEEMPPVEEQPPEGPPNPLGGLQESRDVRESEFDESKHPRADSGQFGSGGGSSEKSISSIIKDAKTYKDVVKDVKKPLREMQKKTNKTIKDGVYADTKDKDIAYAAAHFASLTVDNIAKNAIYLGENKSGIINGIEDALSPEQWGKTMKDIFDDMELGETEQDQKTKEIVSKHITPEFMRSMLIGSVQESMDVSDEEEDVEARRREYNQRIRDLLEMKDESGHEHAGKGEGGGQFVSGSGSGKGGKKSVAKKKPSQDESPKSQTGITKAIPADAQKDNWQEILGKFKGVDFKNITKDEWLTLTANPGIRSSSWVRTKEEYPGQNQKEKQNAWANNSLENQWQGALALAAEQLRKEGDKTVATSGDDAAIYDAWQRALKGKPAESTKTVDEEVSLAGDKHVSKKDEPRQEEELSLADMFDKLDPKKQEQAKKIIAKLANDEITLADYESLEIAESAEITEGDIELMADILGGLFGEDALKFFDIKDTSESAADLFEWEETKHPRGKNGRFIPLHSAEAKSAAKTAIKAVLAKGGKTPDTHKALVEHLSILDTKQLHALKKEYQLSASAKLKTALVEKLADRLGRGRMASEKSPEKPATSVDKQDKSATLVDTGAKETSVNQAGDKKMVNKISPNDFPSVAAKINELGQTMSDTFGGKPHSSPGAHKVYISDMYDAIKDDLEGDVTLSDFKKMLVQMNKQDLVALSRQDLVAGRGLGNSAEEAENVSRWIREKMADSRTNQLDAEFHSVQIHKPKTPGNKVGDKKMATNRYTGWNDDNDEFGLSDQEVAWRIAERKKAGSDFAKKVASAPALKTVDMPRETGWDRDMTEEELNASLKNKRQHGRTSEGMSYLALNGPSGRRVYRMRPDGKWDDLGMM